ncbi:hypothetical protein [Nonomuraea angiospora]|uniref:hypothetical protein n=1 Tax=Nonomuraea angiospora TaxID=46172 RepID=UPI0029B3F241|nr:hypothetical protein [Nonomuraea angiospora]MDX3099684.1 hypothetical protein [Nonomuraea angiospora]
MSNTVPSGRCPVPWCQNDHQATPGAHWQAIADMGLERATVELRYALDDQPDAHPVVLVLYGHDWAPLDRLAIPAPAAAALADLLDLLTVPTLPDFIASLRRAARGPHTPRSTQW